MYLLEKLFSPDDGQTLTASEEKHYIEGEIDDWLIVSVPETTSAAAAMQIQERIQVTTNRPVLVVTHNIEFMRARKASSSEANEIIQRAEAGHGDQANPSTEEGDNIEPEDDSGDGGGPGNSVDGGGDSGMEPGGAVAEGGSVEVDQDAGDAEEGAESEGDEGSGERRRPAEGQAPVRGPE